MKWYYTKGQEYTKVRVMSGEWLCGVLFVPNEDFEQDSVQESGYGPEFINEGPPEPEPICHEPVAHMVAESLCGKSGPGQHISCFQGKKINCPDCLAILAEKS